MRNKLRRPLAFLLSAVMIVTMSGTPVHAVADRGQPETGLCEHHAAHTDDCGYTEETPGTPCGHEHTEDCYIEVTECVHEHTPECYPEETEDSVSGNEATPANAKEREPENCPHICDGESGCITEKLDCRHEHDSECGYTESTPGTPCTFVCEICNPQDSGEAGKEPETGIIKQEQCSCLTLCTEGQINPDCPVCGGLGAGLSDCKGEAEEENADQPEDTGICKHHQEHDADCGYIPKSEDGEGSPCTYECRICPVEDLIADLPDKVTEDNAEEVRAQLEEILALYGELNEDEQEQIDLSRCYALQEALDNANAPMQADGRAEQQNTDEASVTIGTETLYYATLEEAFDAANGKTAIITMLNDSECVHSDSNGSPLNINGGNVTLNLNGNTLSGNGYGNYGIINVSGGSLLVEGKGSISVASVGLSCYESGKLTVEGITLELVGSDIFAASAGVDNEGGTVILNGTQMTGAASEGQIYHYSGTTTINSVTATEATESNPGSVYYQGDSGTLTINGGTFGKITVSSYNNGGVQSVAGLLGEGCAYKKQGGTWATDDELAGLEISNVTVEKIPLTIHPQGDTSWYYSTQQTHTLAMNAAPVDSSDSVTYVWKSGTETLDCTSDTYTVPAGTPVGSYIYTCEATCDGYTLSHTFTFKIEKSGTEFTGGIKTYNGSKETTGFAADDTITVKAAPTATGTAPQKAAARLRADPTAGQMALFVGDVQVSEPVEAGADGTYIMTVSAVEVLLKGNAEPNGNAITLTAKFVGNGNMADAAGTVDVKISAVAMAERDGAVIGYYGESNLADAFARNSENAGATITLLSDVEPSTYLTIQIDCTLDLGGHTITGPMGRSQCVIVETNTAVTIRGEGEITAPNGIALTVNGSVTLEGGTYTSGGSEFSSVYVLGQSAMLSVTGEKVSIRNTSGGCGLIVAQAQSVRLSAGTYSGTAWAISSTLNFSDMLAHTDNIRYAFYQDSSPYAPSGSSLPSGTFTVQECQHTGVEVTNLGDVKHGLDCPYCGYHYEHTTTLTATASGNTVTLNGGCSTEGCGYQTPLGTASFTFPKVTYGQPGDVTCAWDGPTGYYGLIEVIGGSQWQFDKNADEDIAASSWTLAELFGSTKVTAGGHKLKVSFFNDAGVLSNACELDFKIDPAPLTADMVTLSAGSVTYNGTEQKSALTVKHGETPLTEGTDYEVRYTRDGVVTNDFTSAGTVKITVTGKGNYEGEVEKTFTIKQAESDVGTVTAETLENTLDVSQVVLSRTNQTLAGTLMLTDSALKYGTNTYTWKFTPDNTNYKTVTGEVEVTVDDTIAPTGEISIGTNKWNSFLNKITFGLFFKETEQVTITAQDNESGVASVSYYISDSGLTEDEVKALDSWTAGNTDKTTFNISPDQSCVVYARITDNQGNVTYISSDGMVFDGTSPSITGVTDGETYCTSQTVTVTDDNLESVTVNGKEQALSDSKFTLDVKFDTTPIVIAATDKAGNVTTVTVNAGHNYGTDWKSDSNGHWHECAVCGEKSEVLAHTEDSGTVTKPATETEAGTRVYRCSACGYEMRTETIDPIPPTHTHSYGTEWKSDNSNHWHECSCGDKSDSAAHTEDSGTVIKPATETETGTRVYRCSVCGYEMRTEIIEKLPESHTHSYGTEWKSDSNNHWHECSCGEKSDSAAHTEDSGTVTKPATQTETGIRTYKCSVCGYEMRTEIIEKLPESHKHSYGTEWKFDSNNHWHECSCGEKSSTAAHTWDSGTVTVQPTTDKEGEKTYTCTVCGKTKTETLGKLPPSHKHSYGTEWKSDNSNHWHECSCGEKSDTAAHRWDSGTVTVQPTTDKEGEKTYTCTVCGRTKTETVGKLPPSHTHSYGTEWKSDNSNHWHECSCGEKSGTAAHTWDSGTVTVQPTTDREGEKTFTCTVCGRTRTETLDKLPPSHTENSQPGDKKPDNNSNQPDNKNTGENQPGSENTEDTKADVKIPFIKDQDGKNGWDVIRTEEEKAEEGSIINVDMNGSAVVPGDIFDCIKGRDITITFDMGNGIIWSVNGKSITTDKADDIDFSVKTGTNAIPVDIVNNITGERYSILLSLSHEGEFGFTAILSINLGKDNAGLTANLYYYNESTGELEFICADTVAEDGMVSLAFTHASDYAVVIDADSMEQETGAGSTAEAPKTGEESTPADTTDTSVKNDLWNRIWIFVLCGVLVIAGLGIFFVRKKKKDE